MVFAEEMKSCSVPGSTSVQQVGFSRPRRLDSFKRMRMLSPDFDNLCPFLTILKLLIV